MKNFLFGFLLVLSFPSVLFAGTLTLSTTYPSPNGNYKSLQTTYEGIGVAPDPNRLLNVSGSPIAGYHQVRIENPATNLYMGIGTDPNVSITAGQIETLLNGVAAPLVLNPAGGQVGIGTVPGAALDVLGANTTSDLTVRSATTRMDFYAFNNTNNYLESANAANTASAPLNFTGFQNNPGTFLFNGSVGIGVAPATKLQVMGAGIGYMGVSDGSCAGNYTGINLNGLAAAGCANYNILSSPSDQTLYLNRPNGNAMNFREGNVDQMIIASGGNITMLDSLTVNGNLTFPGNVTGNFNVTGSVFANGFIYSSDERLKKNIHPIDHALDKVGRLNGVSFAWKKDGTKDIGVIAQNVEKVFPELVVTNKNGMKAVKYGNIVGVLIEAIKEQQKEIKDQQKDIEGLKKEVTVLEHTLKGLK